MGAGKQLIILTILYGAALGFIWWGSSWRVAVGAFILIWASNVEQSFKKQRMEIDLVERLSRLRQS